jgi:hypothetical protein
MPEVFAMDANTHGDRVREIRKRRGLSQRELANLVVGGQAGTVPGLLRADEVIGELRCQLWYQGVQAA